MRSNQHLQSRHLRARRGRRQATAILAAACVLTPPFASKAIGAPLERAAFGFADALAADGFGTSQATAHVGEPAGRIAFFRFLGGEPPRGAVFTIRTDGTGEKQITHPAPGVFDDYPDWSPDGREIAFQRCLLDAGCTAWVVTAEGRAEPRQVQFRCRLHGECDASGPTWTPDGRLLVTLATGNVRDIDGYTQVQQSAIESVDVHTGEQRTILRPNGFVGDAQDPAASRDGRLIAYTRKNAPRATTPARQALFVVRSDGTNDHRVTPWELRAGDHPEFSPRGTILFRSHDDDGTLQSDLWTVRPDGSNLNQLTHVEPGTFVTPGSYSPDGNWIVHATNGVDGPADLFIMRADGTGNRLLTRTPAWDGEPDWAP
jgi:TolB protein